MPAAGRAVVAYQPDVEDRPASRPETTGADADGGRRPGYRGRRRRATRTSVRVATILGAVILLGAGSAAAYAVWWPPSEGCATERPGCGPAQTVAGAPPVRASRPPAAAPTPATVFAPYLDIQYDPPFDLAGAVRTTGIKQYLLGFIVARNGCTPAWGGEQPIDEEEILARVKAFRAVGGDVRISFGGAAGAELATACRTVPELAAAYQSVIDAYAATKVDFDIEGDELRNRAADTRRGQAIAILERNAAAAGRTLNVSLTIPVNPDGFTASPVWMLNAAAIAHATIHIVNVMAMDYDPWAAPQPAGRMGTFAIRGMTAAHLKVKSVFGLTDAEAWRRMSVTPLIGINDPSDQIFTVADAAKVIAFARSKHAAMVSMWAITRDRPCPAGVTADAESDHCAGNAPTTYAFSKAFTR